MRTTDARHEVRAEPNVAPMIDVMLVLLVVFMLVVPALAAGPRAVPPRGRNLKAHPADEGDRTLAIDRDGRFYLNGRQVARADLAARLRAALADRPDDRLLYVTADRGLDYGTVRDAAAVASAAGVRVVGLVAESLPERSLRK